MPMSWPTGRRGHQGDLAGWGCVSGQERQKPARELYVVEIVRVEALRQVDPMHRRTGVLGQGVENLAAGGSTGLVAIEHQDDAWGSA